MSILEGDGRFLHFAAQESLLFVGEIELAGVAHDHLRRKHQVRERIGIGWMRWLRRTLWFLTRYDAGDYQQADKNDGDNCLHWFDSFVKSGLLGKNCFSSSADWFSCGKELKLTATGEFM